MRRRDLLRVLGTVAIALPTVARAQQADRLRRVGVVMAYAEKDPNGQVQVAGFRQQLQKLGWTEGRNIQIDFRYAADNPTRIRELATELLGMGPDLMVAIPTLSPRFFSPKFGPFHWCSYRYPIR
jgi:putative tryptophan/tyrosine transport system substrate-binding protein